MLRITKDTLRHLNAAIGKLDVDSNQIFTGFVGRLEMSDRLYHGDLHYAAQSEGTTPDTVSLQSILAPTSSEQYGEPTDGIAQD